MKRLFQDWLKETAALQRECYSADYSVFFSNEPDDINTTIEYIRWNMLAIDDELAEMRQAISWKPWQHDDPYIDRDELVKEAVDVLHFVANIICAAGATDEELDAVYVQKMAKNRARQENGYKVRDIGVKCRVCARALDEVDIAATDETICAKCEVAA
jgi:hypothetical protein